MLEGDRIGRGAATPTETERTGSGLIGSIVHRLAGDPSALPIEGQLAAFTGATGWLNTEPLTPEGLRGQVVLVDFWTYTCINWLRTVPYVRAWAAKYAEHGLTVVGVHTPEFAFERDVENVMARTAGLGIEYPVAIDSHYGVWRAFDNHYWPAAYVADADGRIRYHHFGEGEYEMTEMVIQELLLDAGAADVPRDLVMPEPRGLEVAADRRNLASPESYLGYAQARGFASASTIAVDQPRSYAAHPSLPLNSWDLDGTWTVARDASILSEPGGRIAFQFRARDVNLVMGPPSKGGSVRFRVHLDGEIAVGALGTSVSTDGSGIVREQDTYQLIRQPGPIRERRFEIEFLDAGVHAFCFTFG